MNEAPPTYRELLHEEVLLSLPNHYEADPLPIPNYEEVCGRVVLQKNVSTGPTEFRGNQWIRLYGFLTQLTIFFGKILLSIYSAAHIRNSWVNLLYLGSVLNVWIPFMLPFRVHRTMDRFMFKNIIKTPFPYCFLVDILSFLGIPILGYILSPEKLDELLRIVYFGGVLALNTSIAYAIFTSFEAEDHKPFLNCSNFLPLTAYEEHGGEEKLLSIREWGPFKIVIENIGNKVVQGDLTVVRMVYGTLGHMCLAHVPVNLVVPLRAPFLPTQHITIIPITHFLPGAYIAQGFKSFGNDRGVTVETFVYQGKKAGSSEKFCVKRVQVFRRRDDGWKKDVEEFLKNSELSVVEQQRRCGCYS